MPDFLCQVGDRSGSLRRLRVTAADEAGVRRQLAERGLEIFGVRRVRSSLGFRTRAGSGASLRFRRGRVGNRDVLLFNQELAALLEAGLPLAESLAIMEERMENPALRRAVREILTRVRAGTAMSRAVRDFPFFPGVYAACLQAGETSGDLAGMLRRFTGAMKVAVRARSNLVAALVYPAFLLIALVGTAGFLLLGVVPDFIPFFSGFDQELPALTAGLLGAAEFLRDRLLWVLGGVGFLGLAFLAWSRSARAGILRDRLLLRFPAIGEVLRLYGVSQFSRALGTLLAGGMPLAGAIPVAAGAVGNRHLRRRVAPTAREVREGRRFVDALADTGEIPGFALQLVRVGESTGDLARMVTSIADFNDEVIENRVTVLLSLLTPVVLVILGGFVALVLLAIYLPLFGLASAPQF